MEDDLNTKTRGWKMVKDLLQYIHRKIYLVSQVRRGKETEERLSLKQTQEEE